ncbi:hypothetical protein MRX96_030611 [Rhipicephalus microplus]
MAILYARRWWNQTVRSLRLRIPLTVTPSVTCQDAVELMSAEGIDQLPVVEESGAVLGMVSLGNLMSKILARRIDATTPVAKAAYDQFRKVTLDTTLGMLSTMLEHGHFALVVAEQVQVATGVSKTKEVVIGIVTNIDLLRFITKGSKPKTDNGHQCFEEGKTTNAHGDSATAILEWVEPFFMNQPT